MDIIRSIFTTDPGAECTFANTQFGNTTLFPANSKVKFTPEVKASPEKAAGWYDASDNPVSLGAIGVTVTGAPAANDTIVLDVSAYEPAKGNVMANITVTATITGLPDLGEVGDGAA